MRITFDINKTTTNDTTDLERLATEIVRSVKQMLSPTALSCSNEVSQQEAWPRPIPAIERLPEEHSRILAFGWEHVGGAPADSYDGWRPSGEDFNWDVVDYCGGEWIVDGGDWHVTLRDVTHWLPLPPNPLPPQNPGETAPPAPSR